MSGKHQGGPVPEVEELLKGLKDEAEQSLAGWEFGPDLQAKVMARVRAQELLPRSRRSAPAWRPWAAALTAAAVVAGVAVLTQGDTLPWKLPLGTPQSQSAQEAAPIPEATTATSEQGPVSGQASRDQQAGGLEAIPSESAEMAEAQASARVQPEVAVTDTEGESMSGAEVRAFGLTVQDQGVGETESSQEAFSAQAHSADATEAAAAAQGNQTPNGMPSDRTVDRAGEGHASPAAPGEAAPTDVRVAVVGEESVSSPPGDPQAITVAPPADGTDGTGDATAGVGIAALPPGAEAGVTPPDGDLQPRTPPAELKLAYVQGSSSPGEPVRVLATVTARTDLKPGWELTGYVLTHTGRVPLAPAHRTMKDPLAAESRRSWEFSWDQRLPGGALAPTGVYTFRVEMRSKDFPEPLATDELQIRIVR